MLLIHSSYGLTDEVKDRCDELSALGMTACAPDLFGGATADTAAEAAELLSAMDPNKAAALVMSTGVALRAHSNDPAAPFAVIGWGPGGSLALWLAARQPESVRSVVTYYGTTDVDFIDLAAPVLAHFAEHDEVCTIDDTVEFEASLLLLGKAIEAHTYPGTRHGFAESSAGVACDEHSRNQSWARTVEFVQRST